MKTATRRASPQQPADPPRWASVDAAADHVGVHPKTVRRWLSEGRLTGYTAGARLIRIDLNELDRMIRGGGHE